MEIMDKLWPWSKLEETRSIGLLLGAIDGIKKKRKETARGGDREIEIGREESEI